PGFMEHSIVITYGHFSLAFTFFFLSIALMLYGERRPERYAVATIAGVICSAIHLFSLEYYFGIELIRPLLLWFVVSENQPDRRIVLKRTAMAYLPYGAVLAAYILWRIFGFHSHDYALRTGTLGSLGAVLRNLVSATWTSSVQAWLAVFHL